MNKVDASRDSWFRDDTNGLKPFWYECSQLTTPIKANRKSEANGNKVGLVEQSETFDEAPQGLSAMVAKIQMGDISSDKNVLEESDNNNDTEVESESGGSDSDSSDSSDRFLLKINCSNGLCIFDEYIKQ